MGPSEPLEGHSRGAVLGPAVFPKMTPTHDPNQISFDLGSGILAEVLAEKSWLRDPSRTMWRPLAEVEGGWQQLRDPRSLRNVCLRS